MTCTSRPSARHEPSTNNAALFAGIIGFEWRYQTRRLTYAATVVIMALVSLGLVVMGLGPASAAVNGSYIVMETVGLVTLMSVFALPMLSVGAAAVRDDEYRMRELIDARPVPRGLLLGGRFVGVLAAALAVHGHLAHRASCQPASVRAP
jgi:hypothetical protein